jgi:hypothetical protein
VAHGLHVRRGPVRGGPEHNFPDEREHSLIKALIDAWVLLVEINRWLSSMVIGGSIRSVG